MIPFALFLKPKNLEISISFDFKMCRFVTIALEEDISHE